MTDETDECAFLDGKLMLRQFRRGHRAGTDACLLAAALDVRAGDHVIDAGAGVGAAALALLTRAPHASATLIERDEPVHALSAYNLSINHLADRAKAMAVDLFDRSALSDGELLAAGDVVISNPPFFDEDTRRASPEQRRRDAHVLQGGSLADWLLAMVRIAKPGGRLAIIHRPDALPAMLAGWPRGCGAVRLRAVHARADRPAIRILVGATMGSRAPLELLPPFTLHLPEGAFTAEADAIHRGFGAPLL